MNKVLPFRRPSLKDKARGRTLCASGFHKWQIDTAKQFDVKHGKLITIHRCRRCSKTKTTLD